MEQKLTLRFRILFFSIAVFFLTALTLAIAYIPLYVLPFKLLLVFVWIVAFPLVLAFAYDFLLIEGKLSVKKVLLVTLSVVIVSTALIQGAIAIVTPSWSFSVSTDKTAYKYLEENVTVTVILKNTGFITHSFTSGLSDPVLVSISFREYFGTGVWYSPFHENATDFSIGPSSSLERHFTWNQTSMLSQREIELGKYFVTAFIPETKPDISLGFDNLFRAWTSFNITSS